MGKGQIVGYVRVSTADQNTDRQLDGIQLDKVFTDHASGKDTNRPQFQAMMAHLREGDELVVHSMDRLARSLVDLRRTVDDLTAKGVLVRFVKEGLTFGDTNDSCAVLMLSVMGAVAEFERSLLLERQREGIAVAKTKGVYKGRVPTLDEEQAEAVAQRLIEGESASALAREYGVSRATVYNVRERVAPMPWTEEHIIAVDDLFRQHGKLTAQDEEVKALAEQLGRTPTAVSARMRNLQAAHAEPGAYPGTSWHFTKMDRQVADRETVGR
ncbi:resolvase, N terminal domain protein [Mycobacterium avium MAV_120709_2344]|nr:resolvase, N terminal domain protein [Mycobacterium avium MAV_120709_2344]MCA4736182.1 recombinase family protein [Mycobacterium avium subsp. hominissuis]MCA4740858.1 recombinase family protein [Mycobacterium avium subsp. hominissuis]MCA4745305.1 recombinase family protein [Mycobacterium avium subsp. hominissuis]MCA4765151.1 recombinase family protein [Mycobacterium avium subsp. hominissuis]